MNVVSCLSKMYSSVSNYLVIPEKYHCLSERVKQATCEIFSSTYPELCLYTLNKISEYPVLSEFVSGSFCSITGFYMMYTSYRIGKIQKQETSSNAAFRKTCALMGAFCATYGIYTLTSVIAKFFSSLEKSDMTLGHANANHSYIYYNGPYQAESAQASPSVDLHIKARKFLETFLTCPDAKEMYENVIREQGPITVRFEHPSLDEMIAKSHGYWNTETREIVLDSTNPELQQFHMLIYEMINSSQNKEFLSIFEEADQGRLDAMGYAFGIEKFEYETTKRHCFLTASCIEQGAWSFLPKAMSPKDCQVKYSEDFDTRWEKIKHRPHTQIYIDAYNEKYGDRAIKAEKNEL